MVKNKAESVGGLKVGQKVLVLPYDVLAKRAIEIREDGSLYFYYESIVNKMIPFLGSIVTIEKINSSENTFRIQEVGYNWCKNWINTNVNQKTLEVLYG